MYRTFTAKNFRCFDELTFTDLKRINLIAGKNNVGKTALLEALFVHSGAYNPQLTLLLNAIRGLGNLTVDFGTRSASPWDSLLSDYDVTKSAEFIGEHDTVGRSKVTLTILSQPEELKEIEIFLRVPLVVGDLTGLLASSSESVRALRLTHEDRNSHQSKFYLMVRQSEGITMTPSPPPPFQAVYLGTHGRTQPQTDASRFGE